MILSTGRELCSKQQAGVLDRPSDNIHLNALVKQLPHVKVDTREPPFNRASVAKARLLLHTYLEHVELQDPGLLKGTNKFHETLTTVIRLWVKYMYMYVYVLRCLYFFVVF